jgi:hypothetical protein
MPCYVGPCHHGMAIPRVEDGGDGIQTRRAAVNVFNKQSRAPKNRWTSIMGVGQGADKFSPKKETACYEMLHKSSDLDGFLGTTQLSNPMVKNPSWEANLQ